VRELPAVVWLLHAVHGNEISSPDAALALAHHLLAAEGDPGADLARREVIVLVDPLQNPDGRARFLSSNALGRAARPDPEPASAEHDEPWPGGRGNHYLFDMNRDWFAQAHPDKGACSSSTVPARDGGSAVATTDYYFAPPARPVNPHFSRAQQDWLDSFGRAIAARFDAAGQAYFVREVFDSFYPGYGESWPMGHGAVGMTFEQASARGLVWRREDDTRLTYQDGILNHFRAALATVETAARGREKLLRDYLDFRRAAVRDGEQGPVRQYVLVPGRDSDQARRLADLLLGQGIEVRLLAAEARSGDRVFAAGSFIVPLAQPAGRLARNLLDPRVSMDEAFVKEQDRRRRKRLDDEIYDVTGWSLPLAFDVECVGLGAPLADAPRSSDAPPAPRPRGGQGGLAAAVGLRDGRQRGRGAPGRAQGAGGRGGLPARRPRVAGGDRDRTSGREPGRHRRAARPDRAGTRGRGVAADSGYVERVSLGSGRVRLLEKPRVLLAWDRPTSSQSAGWARWVLERRYGQPVSAVRVSALRRVDLKRFDVVVLPSATGDAIGPGWRRDCGWVGPAPSSRSGRPLRWLTRDKVEATCHPACDGRPDVRRSRADEEGANRRRRTRTPSPSRSTSTRPSSPSRSGPTQCRARS
jgi:hypothetical protein